MKVVILAGGLGTRISEESRLVPKPMIEIGGKPILWHVMKLYSSYGFNDFIICAGYKQEIIKEYFFNYYLYNSDMMFDLKNNTANILENHAEPWKVTVVDTGLHTMTGGRIKRIASYINNEPFFLTYGDGVSDVNILKELEFHQKHRKMVTMSCYNPGQRFGMLEITEDGYISEFREKIQGDGNLINIGFMICQPEFLQYIEGDTITLEKEPLENAAKSREIMAYQHQGFWQCMDTIREKQKLEQMWESGAAPWKVWED